MSPHKNVSLGEFLLDEREERSLLEKSLKKAIETAESASSKEMVIHSILADNYMATMTALMKGQGLNGLLAVDDVHQVALTYSTKPSSFETSLLMKIATLQKKGKKWESSPSIRLRAEFRERVPNYLEKLQRVVPLSLNVYRIHATSVINSESIEEPFLGVWGGVIRKRRSKAKGAIAGLSLIEFKKSGSIAFILAKGLDKKNNKLPGIIDFIVDKIEEKMKEPSDLHNIAKVLNLLSEKVFEKYGSKVSVAVGVRGMGGVAVYVAGKISIFSKDGKVLLKGEENSALGANMQKVSRRKGSYHVWKVGELPLKVDYFEEPILISTDGFVDLLDKKANRIRKGALSKLKGDDNAAVLVYV